MGTAIITMNTNTSWKTNNQKTHIGGIIMDFDFNFNKNYETREQIIFGEEYDKKKYPGGCRNFENMSVETLQRLVDEKFADPEDQQNCAPTIEELLEYGKAHKNTVFGGYAISVDRDDYRISIDTINQTFGSREDLAAFSDSFCEADEFSVTTKSGYAWWD